MTFKVKRGEGTWGGDVRMNATFQFNILCPQLLDEARPFSLAIYFALMLHRKNPISEQKSRYVLKSYQKTPPSFFLAETDHQM